MRRVIEGFGRWFASAAGIWQTAVFVGGWIALEKARVLSDPSGYQILYWLTVYSAVTQPVLAYTGTEGARKADEVLERLEELENREIALLEALRASLEASAGQ